MAMTTAKPKPTTNTAMETSFCVMTVATYDRELAEAKLFVPNLRPPERQYALLATIV